MLYNLSNVELTEGMAIHCGTEGKARALFAELDKQNWKWAGIENLKWADNWKRYGNKTCYELAENKKIAYGAIEDFQTDGDYITEFDDIPNLICTEPFKKVCNNEMSEEREKELTEKIKTHNDQTAKADSVTRKSVLEMAMQTVTVDRETQYGSPENNFKTIAGLWSAYIDKTVTAKDVAIMMCLLKAARIKTGHNKADNWVDLIGYGACGAELEGLE